MSDIDCVKELGLKAENYFIKKLNELGVPYEYIDDWYDFEVFGEKVEVKSCRITVKGAYSKVRKRTKYIVQEI